MNNWKDKVMFVEFNCYCGDEPNTLEDKQNLLVQEKEMWDWLKEQPNFWKEAEECEDLDELSSLIEKGTEWLVDRIVLNDGTDFNECSMFWAWKEMSNLDNNEREFIVEYGKAKLNGSTYSIRVNNEIWN